MLDFKGNKVSVIIIHKSFVSDWYRIVTNNPSLCAVCCKLRNSESVVFGSVYMPYDDGSRDRAIEYEAVIGGMQGVLDRCLGSKFVFGGDFNIAKCSSNIECRTLRNFCFGNKLLCCDVDMSCDVNYTFHNDTTNHRSMIAHYSAAALLAMQSAVIPTAIPSVRPSVRPSVCLSVCPSVTRWYPIQTNERRITRSSL